MGPHHNLGMYKTGSSNRVRRLIVASTNASIIDYSLTECVQGHVTCENFLK